MKIRILNPIVIYFYCFIITHVVYGIDLYLKNMKMLLWTIIGLFSSACVFYIYSKGSLWRFAVKDITLDNFSRNLKKDKFFYFFLFLKLLILFYAYFVVGAEFSTLRRDIGEIFPIGFLILVDTFISVLFPIFFVNCLFCKNKMFSTVNNLMILLIFTLSGSRSFALYFVFVIVLTLYSFRKITAKFIVITSLFFPIFVGLIGFLRIVYSPNSYELLWYVNNNIIIPSSRLLSIYNLVKFQIQDMIIRTSTIFEYVPKLLDFQYGKSLFFSFYSMLPGKQINPAVDIHHILFGLIGDINSPYPPTTFSQLYFDFGELGVVIGAMVYTFFGIKVFDNVKDDFFIFHYSVYCSFIYFLVLSLYGDFEIFRLSLSIAILIFLYRSDFKLQ